MIYTPKLWLGSEASFIDYFERHQSEPIGAEYHYSKYEYMRGMRDEDDEGPSDFSFEEAMASDLIEVYEGVGVVSIKGSLVNDESFFNMIFGDTGYPTIARAVNQLLDDEEVHSIVLSLGTNGGDANGISELTDSLRVAGTVKPIYSHTGSSMLSAGYWIGSVGQRVHSTKMGETGSIGAVATFTSVSERLKKNGMKPYVSRSSPKKALPHPYEPLTQAGKDIIDKDVKTLHGFFIDHVVGNRPNLSSEGAETGWASGETFYGQEAMSLGLVDGPLMTLNDLVQKLNQDHNTQQLNSGENQMPTRVVLPSTEDRIKVANGTPLAEVGMTEEVPETSANTPVEGDGTDLSAESPAEGETVEGTVELEAEPEGAEATGLTAYLRTEVTGLKEELAAASAANRDLAAKLADSERLLETTNQTNKALEKLRPVALKAVERLQVGLGHRAMDLSNMPSDMLASTFDQLNEELSALPVGQQTVQAESNRTDAQQTQESLESYRLTLVPQAS